MVAVFGLIDWEEARYLWRMDRRDFGLMALTVVAALSLDIEQEETASKEPVSTPS
jgi:SulP family sulfate permease